MKKLFWIPALSLLTLFAACKKEDNTTATPTDPSHLSFTSNKKINDSYTVSLTPTDKNNNLSVSRQTSSPVATTFFGKLKTSSADTTISIRLYVPGEKPATFSFDTVNFFSLYTDAGLTTLNTYQMASGKMQINTWTDTEIGGTFSGKAANSTSDTLTITNGLFYYKKS